MFSSSQARASRRCSRVCMCVCVCVCTCVYVDLRGNTGARGNYTRPLRLASPRGGGCLCVCVGVCVCVVEATRESSDTIREIRNCTRREVPVMYVAGVCVCMGVRVVFALSRQHGKALKLYEKPEFVHGDVLSSFQVRECRRCVCVCVYMCSRL